MPAPTDRLSAALADRYTIERELGQGGMATVYLARDLKHEREVAIKVLKPELAAVLGAERFVTEIKTTAALQHPNILPLFDSGEADGFLYYVMPYVEGETLRAKLDRETQLGVEEAVQLIREVADALQYAHEHGVVHRDIKPENILLHAGRPMVADFGIALAVSAAAGGRMTETGLSLGTPHYMSPEQATAEKHITNRSDIYSLAAVLYEMLTGEPPHTGTSAQQIIMRIVTETPRLVTEVRASVPPNVAAAVTKALAKLPADRFDSAKAFAEALHNPAFRLGDTSIAGEAYAVGAGRGWRAQFRNPFVIVPSVVALGAIVATTFLARRTPIPASAVPPIQFVLTTTDSVSPTTNGPWPAAISPDGGRVVYIGIEPNRQSMLYLLRTNELTAHPIPGTAGADQPFFSPDGNWIGFEQNGRERKVRLDGSSPITIVTSGLQNDGATWTSDGEIVFGASLHTPGLSRVSAGGGQPVVVTHPDSATGEWEHDWPVTTPDPNVVVFAIWRGTLESSKLAAVSLADGRVTRLGIAGIRPLAVVDGQLVYVQADGSVMAVPFDIRHPRVTGPPVPVHDPVYVDPANNGNSSIFVSQGGAMITGKASSTGRLVWVSRDGATRPAAPEVRDYTKVSLSPDGHRIAAVVSDERGRDLWIYDTVLGTLSRLTSTGKVVSADWAYDGSVVFLAPDSASHATVVWLQPTSGGAPPRKLFAESNITSAATLSPDGASLILGSYASTWVAWGLLRVSLDSTGIASRYAASQFSTSGPQFSPDGRWVAYYSRETGRPEVYVRSFPDPSTKVQVSVGGGALPKWSRDGSRLYYLTRPDRMVVLAAHLTYSPGLHVTGRDTVVSAAPGLAETKGYGVSPDAKRVLAVDPVSSEFQLLVSPNWITELRRRLAAGAGEGTK